MSEKEILIMMATKCADLERQLEEARDERECLRLLLLNWSGLLQSDIDNELNKLKEQG